MVTKPAVGDAAWGPPLNAALDDLQAQVTAAQNLAGNLSTTAPAFGLTGWTMDPAMVSTGQLLVNGTLYLTRFSVGTSVTATRLFWGINTAGVTPTAGQNFVSVWDSSGTRLANVNVDGRITSTGLFQEAVSVSVTPGFYWAGFLVNAATAPQVYRAQALNGTLANVGLTSAQLRFATNGTGLTSTPASITPGSNSVSMFSLFAALAP